MRENVWNFARGQTGLTLHAKPGMILVIDAFNLIYKFPELEENMYRGELEAAMSGLVATLQQAQKKSKKRFVWHIFFDGKRKPGDETRSLEVGGMTLYYSQDLSADHLIMEFVKRTPSPGEVKVVSSDKKLMDFVRKHRCARQSSEEFAAWVQGVLDAEDVPPPPGKKEDPELSKSEVDFWRDMFRKRKP